MLTVDFVPHCDGVSTFSYQYALGLARAGHTVHVVAPRAKGCASSDAAEPFTTTRFPGYSLGVCRGVPFCLAAIWRILTFRPDLILPMNIAYGGMLCMLTSALAPGPYVTFAYAFEFLKFSKMAPLANLYRRIYTRSLFTVAISRFTARELCRFGVPESHIRIIPPGVQDPLGDGVLPQRDPASPATIGICGRVIHRKGHDLIIRALPTVKQTLPNLRLRIAGEGPERDRLKALADQLGVADNVSFLGRLPQDALGDFYQSLDVFVMPARHKQDTGHVEGFGIVYLEAAMYGVPSIATRTGGIPDAIEDGVSGILVESENVEQLSDAIVKLLTEPELKSRMATAARQRAKSRFQWKVLVASFDAEVQKCLRREPSPSS